MRQRVNLSLVALVVVVGLLTAAGVSACGSASPQSHPTSQTTGAPQSAGVTQAKVRTVVTHADFSVLYSTLQQLVSDAPIVIRGKVESISYFDHQGETFTSVGLLVTEGYKGQIKRGAKVTVVEPGGITTMAAIMRSNSDKFPELTPGPAEENTPLEVLFGGAPLTKVGDDVVYFAFKGDIGGLTGDYYESIGAFQGKFTVSGGIARRYVPADMASSSYGPLTTSSAALDTSIAKAVVSAQ